MDYVFLALVLLYAVKGAFKGFLSMLFSIFGLFSIAVISWYLCAGLSPILDDFFGNSIASGIQNILDESIPGEFSSVEELLSAISESTLGKVFGLVLQKILGDVAFDGMLSAGQILSPILSALAVQVIAFVVLFLCFSILLKIIFSLLEKFVFAFHLSGGNRALGAVLGAVKGFFIFGILYFVLLTLSNFVLSEQLSAFLQNGEITSWIYENFLSKVIDFLR